jgi:hypothetical protein
MARTLKKAGNAAAQMARLRWSRLDGEERKRALQPAHRARKRASARRRRLKEAQAAAAGRGSDE